MSLEIQNVIEELAKHPTKRYLNRDPKQLRYAVVHHSGTSDGNPYAYARYHVNTQGWPGIGYHYVIQRDGTIYKTNENSTQSYHCGKHNSYAIGICLTGNFNWRSPEENEVQYEALIALLRVLIDAYPNLTVKGHRELRQTSCPGEKFDLEKLRADVAEKEE